MLRAKYLFADMVVVDGDQIGVIVKTWLRSDEKVIHEVYVRSYRTIREYDEDDIERYRVRHKELDEEELEWQAN